MDGSRFEVWTRRRFGLAAAGIAAVFSGPVGPEAAAARKRKKKKKRCTKLGRVCRPSGKRKCCKNLKCRLVQNDVGMAFHCCKNVGAICGSPGDCCSGFCLDDRCQPGDCREIDAPCAGVPCCSGNCGADDHCDPPLE
jgi:hypothetical protein